MTTAASSDALRVCFLGDGRGSWAGRAAVVCAWILALAILCFNASFGALFPDGNLLIRGVATLILSAPLLWLFARAKKHSLRARKPT